MFWPDKERNDEFWKIFWNLVGGVVFGMFILVMSIGCAALIFLLIMDKLG